jgi:hypothetical protein
MASVSTSIMPNLKVHAHSDKRIKWLVVSFLMMRKYGETCTITYGL